MYELEGHITIERTRKIMSKKQRRIVFWLYEVARIFPPQQLNRYRCEMATHVITTITIGKVRPPSRILAFWPETKVVDRETHQPQGVQLSQKNPDAKPTP
jgi:hypothetical protein